MPAKATSFRRRSHSSSAPLQVAGRSVFPVAPAGPSSPSVRIAAAPTPAARSSASRAATPAPGREKRAARRSGTGPATAPIRSAEPQATSTAPRTKPAALTISESAVTTSAPAASRPMPRMPRTARPRGVAASERAAADSGVRRKRARGATSRAIPSATIPVAMAASAERPEQGVPRVVDRLVRLAEREPLDPARGVGLGEGHREQHQAGGRRHCQRRSAHGQPAIVRQPHRGAQEHDPEGREDDRQEADLLGELDRVGREVAPVEGGERRPQAVRQLLGELRVDAADRGHDQLGGVGDVHGDGRLVLVEQHAMGVDRGRADEPLERRGVDGAPGGALEQRSRGEEVGLDLDRRAHDPVREGRAHLRVAHRLHRPVGEAVLVEQLDPQIEQDRPRGERQHREDGADACHDPAAG